MVIEESTKLVILGITIDKRLILEEHVGNLCRAAENKSYALCRIKEMFDTGKILCLHL